MQVFGCSAHYRIKRMLWIKVFENGPRKAKLETQHERIKLVRLNAFSLLLEDEQKPTLEHERLRKIFEDDIKANLAGFLSKCQVSSMTRYVEKHLFGCCNCFTCKWTLARLLCENTGKLIAWELVIRIYNYNQTAISNENTGNKRFVSFHYYFCTYAWLMSGGKLEQINVLVKDKTHLFEKLDCLWSS